jgi:hypothetical protein
VVGGLESQSGGKVLRFCVSMVCKCCVAGEGLAAARKCLYHAGEHVNVCRRVRVVIV